MAIVDVPSRPEPVSRLDRLRTRVRPVRNLVRRSLRAEVRTARRLLADPGAPPGELIAAAGRMVRLHRRGLALRLLAQADRGPVPDPRVVRARRAVPGFTGVVPRAVVRRAARAASEAHGGGPVLGTTAAPLGHGFGFDVEAVVRHTVWPGRERMVRKTFRSAAPAEPAAYAAGLLVPGAASGWRAPEVYAVLPDPPGRWHVFLEDLGDVERPSSPDDLRDAARALAGLGAAYADGTATAGQDWLPGFRPLRLGRLRAGTEACARALAGADPAAADRLRCTFAALLAREPDLLRLVAAAPLTLCHADAHPGNLARDPRGGPGDWVLFDWASVALGPLGTDLGDLLASPNDVLRRSGAGVAERAVAQYLDGVPGRRDLVEAAYRHRLVTKSLTHQALRATPSPRTVLPGDVHRVCDAADALLGQL